MHDALRRKLILMIMVALGIGRGAAAIEPVDDFLQALRKRGMFDEALIYLELIESDDRIAEPIRQQVGFEKGVTFLENAGSQRDLQSDDPRLERAAELLRQFVADHPDHPMIGSANIQLANIFVVRARAGMAAAARDGADRSELASAREQFDEAREKFDEIETDLTARLAKLPKLVSSDDEATRELKQRLAGDLAQVRLLRPSIDFELAESYEPGSRQANKLLRAAAEGYHELYEAYRTRSAGLLARLREGRCYQQLGETTKALGCFRTLIDLPDSEQTRSLRAKGTRHALECLTAENEKKYQEAIERGQKWEQAAGRGQTDRDALAIRYLMAVAYRAQSTALRARDPNRKKLAGFARQYVAPVAQRPGQYQRPAKMMLVALKAPPASKDADDSKPTFSTAFQQARVALEQMQDAEQQLQALAGDGDQQNREALARRKRAGAAEAVRALRQALQLADANVGEEELSSARYYLCFLEWDAGHLFDAAVLGEFLARRYPDSMAGRQGARIALAAYIKMYADSTKADKQFETARIEKLGKEIFERWPGQTEADEAALQLLSFATTRGEWDQALEYLKKVSADSPRRGQAELRAGQALWSAYLRRANLPQDERPPQDELDALKKQAQSVLEDGITRMEASGNVDATLAAAVFALAQICVDTGQADAAIKWLEHEKVGPLTLIKANHPVAARPSFPIESYKLALRAYIAVHPQQLEKAEEAMDALEKLVAGGGDAKAAENLTAIYVSLGRELEQHLQDLRKSGQTDQLEAVSQAFEIFLDRVVSRESGSDYASLNWVAATYYSLGGGFDDGQVKTSSKATDYFKKAADAYGRMLELAEKNPDIQKQPESLLGVRLRLAECHRRANAFDKSIEIITDVLKQKPSLLPAQVQAAETYQARGQLNAKSYAMAILGGAPTRDGRNTIWGWAKLSKMTMNDDRFAPIFHKARRNMAEARFQYGLGQKNPKRDKVLEAAKQDLWLTYKLRPELGGEESRAEYDRLLRRIQSALGGEEIGLEEFQQRESAAATTATAETDPS